MAEISLSLPLQSTQGELLHISLVMLVTSIFFLWFAWDAIICENAFELLASGVLGLAVCARIIYFVVRRSVSLLTIHCKCITIPCFAYVQYCLQDCTLGAAIATAPASPIAPDPASPSTPAVSHLHVQLSSKFALPMQRQQTLGWNNPLEIALMASTAKSEMQHVFRKDTV